MDTQAYQEELLTLARKRFGQFLRQWLRSGSWTTKTPAEWAKAAGLPQISNNTVSFICNGTQPKTSPKFFTTLGYLNQRLANRDYGPISDRRLKDRVEQLDAVRHPNGTPWGAVDFFACYIGQLEPPSQFAVDDPVGKLELLELEGDSTASSSLAKDYAKKAAKAA